MCELFVNALPHIEDSCKALGYDVVTDALRIVDGLESQTTKLVLNALPVVILPVVDITRLARFAIPSWDGSACIFQLAEPVDSTTTALRSVIGVDRLARVHQTESWLGVTNGAWKHGWLEDLVRDTRWYAYAMTTRASDPLGVVRRHFDFTTGEEVNCTVYPMRCLLTKASCWGDLFCIRDFDAWVVLIAISNGRRLGLFLFELATTRQIVSAYKTSTLISNLSIFRLLLHWLLAMIALHRHNRQSGHLHESRPVGIGVLARMYSFGLYPIVILPRLRNSLAAFFASGCLFEGEQEALSESWFAIYPAIAEVVFFYFSVLNIVARILRRRVSDAGIWSDAAVSRCDSLCAWTDSTTWVVWCHRVDRSRHLGVRSPGTVDHGLHHHERCATSEWQCPRDLLHQARHSRSEYNSFRLEYQCASELVT